MRNKIIYIKIIDDTQKYCQKECLVCYHGDKIPLEVKTGRITRSLKKVNIYAKKLSELGVDVSKL